MFRKQRFRKYSEKEYKALQEDILSLIEQAKRNIKSGSNTYHELLRIRNELMYMV